MSQYEYSRIDIGEGKIVIQCGDCGAHVINGTEADVKHSVNCTPGDAERWRQHYSQTDVITDEEEEEMYAKQVRA